MPQERPHGGQAGSQNTEPLNFRVDPAFKRRFKQRALDADLKLNELLKAALAAWEEKHGLRE